MSWLRRNPVFVGALLALGLVVVAEVGFVGERRAAARAARKRFDQVNRELRAQEAIQPAATPENVALIEADLARAAQTLAVWQAALRPTGEKAARFFGTKAPVRRPDAFFDLAEFVETMRLRSRRAGVSIRPDERFGFSNYAHEAPETGRLRAVFRERLILEYLLEALLAAQPHQLLSVQRSRPGGKPGVGATGNPEPTVGRGAPGADAADYFEIDPRISARVPGLVETVAFRVSFTGHTDALRTLLTKLAEFELPVVVRAVEVAPAEHPPAAVVTTQPAPAPLVASAWTRFTVTVEFVEPVLPPPTTA